MDTISSEILKSIDPVTPAVAYVGGKRRLAKTLVKIIEEISHNVSANLLPEWFAIVTVPPDSTVTTS
ncbi:hypothetical protein [Bartonella sp. B17]